MRSPFADLDLWGVLVASLGEEFDRPDNREHGAHIPCQTPDFVIAACGYLLDWNEQSHDDNGMPMCEDCLAVERCPLCGARFKSGGWR
ncbi:hypothetical protein [Microbacterium sp. NPDC055665]